MNKWLAIGRNLGSCPTDTFYINYDASLEEAILSVYKYIRSAEAHVIDQVVTYEDHNVFLGWNESVVAGVYVKDSAGTEYEIYPL